MPESVAAATLFQGSLTCRRKHALGQDAQDVRAPRRRASAWRWPSDGRHDRDGAEHEFSARPTAACIVAGQPREAQGVGSAADRTGAVDVGVQQASVRVAWRALSCEDSELDTLEDSSSSGSREATE
eukprot:9064957-Heterocapsa_arctica.AAC.1